MRSIGTCKERNDLSRDEPPKDNARSKRKEGTNGSQHGGQFENLHFFNPLATVGAYRRLEILRL